MDQIITDFLKQNKELFQKPADKIDWEQVYIRANDKLDYMDVGQFTKMLFNKNIHPEKYLSELPNCFLCRSDITSFEIADNITSIGDRAFSGCSNLTSITISDSVTSIGVNAFVNCASLASVTIPSDVISIGEGAFMGCMSLTSIAIPDSVTNIGSSAFSRCYNLTSVSIPDSVTNIGDDAFWNCGENLVINYKGTKTKFRALIKGVFNRTYFTCHCIDGDIIKKKR